MKLDACGSKPDTEPLTDRLWRRYGRRAFTMLEAIRDDPTMGEDIMGTPTTCASNCTRRPARS